ncbi:mucin-2-like, partial [Anneissia japonica]|uniref:mucin-2-like n=1 Tax=Anneissia japonica TaxID=1529436 RepID=UPI0014257E2A
MRLLHILIVCGCFAATATSEVTDAPEDETDVNHCSMPSAPTHGSAACTLLSSKTICNATCFSGYEFPDGVKNINNTCEYDKGVWSPYHQLPDCEPVCTTQCANGGSCIAPDKCSCLTGFSGTFCETADVQHCSNPASPSYGSVVCDFNGATVKCTAECLSGYRPPDISQYVCDKSTGSWNPTLPIPDCQEIITEEVINVPPVVIFESDIKKRELTVENYESDGHCTTWGQDHYRTFDGKMYSFHGSCNYQLLGDTMNTFKIYIKNDKHCTPYRPCDRSIDIYISNSIVYTLKRLDGSPVVYKDSKLQTLPMVLSGLEIEMVGLSTNIIVHTQYGFELHWDGDDSVSVIAQSDLFNNTRGLCGTYNNNPEDDFMLHDGTITTSPASCGSDYTMNPAECSVANQLRYCIIDVDIQRAKHSCQAIKNETFADCHPFVRYEPYYEACQEDVCNCNCSRTDCACNSYEAYARECARHKVYIDWRTEERCPITCDAGLVSKQCGSSCPRTCSSATYDCLDNHCIDGCHCPDDKVLHNNMCIEHSECPCNYQCKEYSSGSYIESGCNKCLCKGGKWNCTEDICPATCSAVGDPHYETFDGKHYHFHGDCSYTLVQSCDGLNTDYSIQVENTKCGFQSYACTKKVMINVGATKVKLHQKHILTVNGEDIDTTELPYSASGVYIEQVSSIYQRVTLDNGLIVLWDGFVRVYVTAPPSFFGKYKMCGLCGSYDRVQNNDFMTKAGDIEKQSSCFASKWKVDPSCPVNKYVFDNTSPCDIYSHRKLLAEAQCKLLKNDIFVVCSRVLSVDEYFENCKYDVCANSDINVFCASIADYADACGRIGVPIMNWRLSYPECAVTCSGDTVYQECGSACEVSCAALTTNMLCKETCIPGCSCTKGRVLDYHGRCIPIRDCPCDYNGRNYNPGETTKQGCKDCVCTNALWQCDNSTCDSNESFCGENMEFVDCHNRCPVTCSNYYDEQKSCSTSICEPGCQCLTNYILDGDRCVLLEDCPCHHGEKAYINGESYIDNCNLCTCNGQKWTCEENECPGICSMYGESHFTSFDAKLFEFRGECVYTLMQSTDDCDFKFSLKSENVKCGSSGVSCTIVITFSFTYNGISDEIKLVRGKKVEESSYSLLKVHRVGSYVYVAVSEGITLQWDMGTLLYIKLDPKYAKRVTGLCGNYDGDNNNDFVTSSAGPSVATAIEFADNWRAIRGCPDSKVFENPCSQVPEREAWAKRKCAILKSDIFSACHSELPYDSYYQRCVADACGCDFGGDCECLCTAVKAYAHDCMINGVVVYWRSNDFCPIQCDGCGSWVPCMTPCPKTCTNYCCDEKCEIDGCVEGCQCEEGLLYDPDTEKCVSQKECSTTCRCISTTITPTTETRTPYSTTETTTPYSTTETTTPYSTTETTTPYSTTETTTPYSTTETTTPYSTTEITTPYSTTETTTPYSTTETTTPYSTTETTTPYSTTETKTTYSTTETTTPYSTTETTTPYSTTETTTPYSTTETTMTETTTPYSTTEITTPYSTTEATTSYSSTETTTPYSTTETTTPYSTTETTTPYSSTETTTPYSTTETTTSYSTTETTMTETTTPYSTTETTTPYSTTETTTPYSSTETTAPYSTTETTM